MLMMGLAGCGPKVIEDPKDPFVLGTNVITEVNINMKTKVTITSTAPLTSDILKMDSWLSTTETVLTSSTKKMALKDDQGYVYDIYRQKGKYLVSITHKDYTTPHRYWIDPAVMTTMISNLSEKYLTKPAGTLEFVKAYWGTDRTTVFEVDPVLMSQFYETSNFTATSGNFDLSRRHAEFSLIDELGNEYQFYGQAQAVRIIWAKDGSSELFSFDFSEAMRLYKALTENYTDKTIVNQLGTISFTQAYLEGLDTFGPSKMFRIYPKISDILNELMKLNRAFKADLLPDEQSECKFIFKDDAGLYYVLCYNPYVIGVGPDPKGTLTYYSLGDYNDTDLGGYVYDMPVPAPSGSRIDNFTFTRVNAVMHCECDQHVDLSLTQSNYLNALMDLADNAKVVLDFVYPFSNLEPQDLFYLSTTSGKRLDFKINDQTRTIVFTIDYNGFDHYGTTYYQIDGAGYDKVLEAHFYLSNLLFPTKADANPTFDAFNIGDVLSSTTAIIDLPMKTLTTDQINAIDGRLQRSKWQDIPLFDEAIKLNSRFVLRKNSNEFYIFSRVGAFAVVNDVIYNGETKVYLIPADALEDVLALLKTY